MAGPFHLNPLSVDLQNRPSIQSPYIKGISIGWRDESKVYHNWRCTWDGEAIGSWLSNLPAGSQKSTPTDPTQQHARLKNGLTRNVHNFRSLILTVFLSRLSRQTIFPMLMTTQETKTSFYNKVKEANFTSWHAPSEQTFWSRSPKARRWTQKTIEVLS